MKNIDSCGVTFSAKLSSLTIIIKAVDKVTNIGQGILNITNSSEGCYLYIWYNDDGYGNFPVYFDTTKDEDSDKWRLKITGVDDI